MNQRNQYRAAAPAFLAAACVGFLASAPALAEDDGDADEAADSSQIVVEGQVPQAELKGPKATAEVVNTPRSVVVLPEEVIQNSGSASLAEALRTVPGITFGAAEGGNPIGDRPFIRGFDSQGSTFVDGVRDPAAQTREVFATDQVQIVRGSDSTLGGRGSAGGSINIISKLPVAGDFIRGTGSLGTADYKRVTGDVNTNLGGTVGVRVAGVWHDQDVAGRDSVYSRRWGVSPSITWGMGTDTRVTASYYYLQSEELPDSGIPYFYTIGNAPGTGTIYSEPLIGSGTTIGGVTGTVDRAAFYGLEDRDFRDATTHQATLRAEHEFGDLTLRNTTRYTHNDQAYIYTQPDDQQGNVYGTNPANPATAGGLVWRRANTRYGTVEAVVNQTDLYGTAMTGSIEHSFATGLELSWEEARRGTFVTRGYLNANGVEILATGSTITPRCTAAAQARYYCTSLFNPNPADPWVNYTTDTSTVVAPIVKSLPIEETQNNAQTISAYGFDSATVLPNLILSLGVRFDRYKTTVEPGQAASATSRFELSRTDDLFNWQAGAVYKPTPNTSLYASYATAATPPNTLIGEGLEGNALGTTNTAAALAQLQSLEVEQTRSYEVGFKAQLFDNQLATGIALFNTDTSNARVTGPNNTVEFIGERRIRGVELTFNGNVTRWWTVFGGYTYLDAEIVDGGFTALTAPAVPGQAAKTVLVPSVNTGRKATQTAENSFTLWSEFHPTSRFSIGGGAFYTSRVFGGYSDNRSATQNSAGVVTVNPATKLLVRTVPGYWRFDLRAGYLVNDNIELSVNVNNVTDEVYFTQAYTAHYATIAPGRSAFATVSLRY